MNLKFTDKARKVMELAEVESRRLHHEYVGTEHILIGLLNEGSGASKVLQNLGIDIDEIREEIKNSVAVGPGPLREGTLPQTPRCKMVLEFATEESRSLGQNVVGTEHLLLGMLREEEGVAAQVLENFGVKLEILRTKILHLLEQ